MPSYLPYADLLLGCLLTLLFLLAIVEHRRGARLLAGFYLGAGAAVLVLLVVMVWLTI